MRFGGFVMVGSVELFPDFAVCGMIIPLGVEKEVVMSCPDQAIPQNRKKMPSG